MLKLSAIIITRNEEANIGRCLQALHNVADEIVVVDSLSTDSTKQICESFGVKFIEHEWEGFDKQKNFANTLASNDLILSVDADEVLSEQLQQSILELKNHDEYASGYVFSMARLAFFCGKWIRHSGWYPERKQRIWNRNEGEWRGIIHETLFFNKEVKTISLKGDLLHYISDSDVFNKEKSDKYAHLQAQQMYDKGRKCNKIKVLYKTFWAFFYTYVCRFGFLDGKVGYKIALNKAVYTNMKYRLLREKIMMVR